MIAPKSVIDVGCGIGAFLAEFGPEIRVLGIEATWIKEIDEKGLSIPQDKFMIYDLATPINLTDKFDLVICLEVGEHLEEKFADILVNNLTKLGPVILFSAAIPYQGGTHHLNEQWPSYWAKKFRKKGYFASDIIRRKIWNKKNVAYWYRQNTGSVEFLYFNNGRRS